MHDKRRNLNPQLSWMAMLSVSSWAVPVSPRLIAPPGRRARLDVLGKHPREVALIGKTGVERDRTERLVGIEDQFLGALDALLQQPLVRRTSHGLLEGAAEMARRQPARARQFRQAEITGEIGAQQFLGAPLLPWRQSATA